MVLAIYRQSMNSFACLNPSLSVKLYVTCLLCLLFTNTMIVNIMCLCCCISKLPLHWCKLHVCVYVYLFIKFHVFCLSPCAENIMSTVICQIVHCVPAMVDHNVCILTSIMVIFLCRSNMCVMRFTLKVSMSFGADVYILFSHLFSYSAPWPSWDDCI